MVSDEVELCEPMEVKVQAFASPNKGKGLLLGLTVSGLYAAQGPSGIAARSTFTIFLLYEDSAQTNRASIHDDGCVCFFVIVC